MSGVRSATAAKSSTVQAIPYSAAMAGARWTALEASARSARFVGLNDLTLEVSDVGQVVEVGDGIARIYGLGKVMSDVRRTGRIRITRWNGHGPSYDLGI